MNFLGYENDDDEDDAHHYWQRINVDSARTFSKLFSQVVLQISSWQKWLKLWPKRKYLSKSVTKIVTDNVTKIVTKSKTQIVAKYVTKIVILKV